MGAIILGDNCPGEIIRWAVIQAGMSGFMMADGRVVETENLKKFLDTILKLKKKKEDQYEEKIIQICEEEFDLNKEEVLTSLIKAVDDRMSKIVNKKQQKFQLG